MLVTSYHNNNRVTFYHVFTHEQNKEGSCAMRQLVLSRILT